MTRTNAAGQTETITTTYTYDKLNRLTKTTFADGSFTRVEYNAIGQQAATIDQLGHRYGVYLRRHGPADAYRLPGRHT